ncbi:hypothetical protein ACIBH1_40765 [Nonomuraea sp. NPDC050663]|uniref:hypothetical protein n=1 Tax=Nonomuraea sp. NPDC050663 TaxID=3364370 RepID=UPI00379F8FE1
MSNPASALAGLLAAWHVPANKRPEDPRGIRDVPALEFWQSQGRAVGLMLDIERALAGLEMTGFNIKSFQDGLPHWYRAVFAYSVPWQQNSNAERPLLDAAYLSLLEGLGTLLEVAQASLVLLPSTLEQLAKALDEIEDLIKITPELGDDSRRYMLSLIWELKLHLSEIDTFGTANVQNTIYTLAGAMHSQAARMFKENPEAGRTFFQKATQLVGIVFPSPGSSPLEITAGGIDHKELE